jgi:transcriptional regulator with XRE-family HTH domain
MTTTLSELRSKKKLSQKALADELSLSPSAIAMYELGKRTPGLHTALRIAGYFRIPVDQISFARRAHDTRSDAN